MNTHDLIFYASYLAAFCLGVSVALIITLTGKPNKISDDDDDDDDKPNWPKTFKTF